MYKIMNQNCGDKKEDVNFYYLQKNGEDCKLTGQRYFFSLHRLCCMLHLHLDDVEKSIESPVYFKGSTIDEICTFKTIEEFTELMCEYII